MLHRLDICTAGALVVQRLGYLPSKQATRVRLPADAFTLYAVYFIVYNGVSSQTIYSHRCRGLQCGMSGDKDCSIVVEAVSLKGVLMSNCRRKQTRGLCTITLVMKTIAFGIRRTWKLQVCHRMNKVRLFSDLQVLILMCWFVRIYFDRSQPNTAGVALKGGLPQVASV